MQAFLETELVKKVMTAYETSWAELKKMVEMVTPEGNNYSMKEISNVFMWLHVKVKDVDLTKKLLLDTTFERETGKKLQDRKESLLIRFSEKARENASLYPSDNNFWLREDDMKRI